MGIYLNPANKGFEMDVNTDTYVASWVRLRLQECKVLIIKRLFI